MADSLAIRMQATMATSQIESTYTSTTVHLGARGATGRARATPAGFAGVAAPPRANRRPQRAPAPLSESHPPSEHVGRNHRQPNGVRRGCRALLRAYRYSSRLAGLDRFARLFPGSAALEALAAALHALLRPRLAALLLLQLVLLSLLSLSLPQPPLVVLLLLPQGCCCLGQIESHRFVRLSPCLLLAAP